MQPGVTREQLNSYLRDTGLFFPVDPGANATLGGMVSTRASGTTTIRYGAMTRNVLALQVVLADGRIVRVGTRAAKSSTGYDLVRLLVGSEGTLGVITEITLRLYGVPERTVGATCVFPALRGAVDAVVEIIQSGASVSRIEFLDELQVRACNRYSQLSMPEQPTLFLEFSGTSESVDGQLARAQEIAQSNGGAAFQWAADDAERARLWKARHSAYFAALALRPGCECLVADVCVPISQLADAVADARRDIDAAGLLAPIVGHVGDGNFHVLFLLQPGVTDEWQRAEKIYDAMIDRALRVGGTCTGEHGIGQGKRTKLVEEYGADVVELMRVDQERVGSQGHSQPGQDLPMNSELGLRTLRKVAWRLIPFMVLLYFVAFLDRVNIGFAALTMNADLGLTPSMFGFGVRHLLHRLCAVRGAEQHHHGARRRAAVDRTHHDHVGPAVGRHRVRVEPDQPLRAALPARRRGGRLLPGHDPAT